MSYYLMFGNLRNRVWSDDYIEIIILIDNLVYENFKFGLIEYV